MAVGGHLSEYPSTLPPLPRGTGHDTPQSEVPKSKRIGVLAQKTRFKQKVPVIKLSTLLTEATTAIRENIQKSYSQHWGRCAPF